MVDATALNFDATFKVPSKVSSICVCVCRGRIGGLSISLLADCVDGRIIVKYVTGDGDLGTKKSLGTASNEFNEVVDQAPISGGSQKHSRRSPWRRRELDWNVEEYI